MKKRYWYDLSDTEIEKLENEWQNSKWCKKAKEESKKVSTKETSFYICITFTIIFLLVAVIIFINLIRNSDNLLMDETIPYYIFSWVFSLVGAVFGGLANGVIKNAKSNYIAEQKKKWLLDKHNVIK